MAVARGRERVRIHAKQNGGVVTVQADDLLICLCAESLPNVRSEAETIGRGAVMQVRAGACASGVPCGCTCLWVYVFVAGCAKLFVVTWI